jgi:hypothetical protein
MNFHPTIALLTDFGLEDPYVGIMKGVIASLCPEARFIDLTHDIAAGDVGAAAFWLEKCKSSLPASTIFLAVVDPTVGTQRRALCASVEGCSFIGPDNGIFEDLLLGAERRGQQVEVVEIDPTQVPRPGRGRSSQTFHGRDLFAPAAGLLASGKEPVDLGWPAPVDTLVRKRFQRPIHHSVLIAGQTARVRIADHFGNLVTDFLWTSDDDPGVFLSGSRLPWRPTYAEAEPGRLFALRGSFDTVELAMQGQSALKHLMG